jgi:DNA-binding PadR family transcriptional regulator
MEPNKIYRTLIRLHVLIEATRRPLDSADVSVNLHDRGVKLGPVPVRHILRRFEAEGYLTSTLVRNSRQRKVYTITAAGRRKARDANEKLRSLIDTFGSEKLRK